MTTQPARVSAPNADSLGGGLHSAVRRTLGRTLIVSNLNSSQVWSGTDVRKIGGPIGNDRSTISQSSIAEWSHNGTLMADLILEPSKNSSTKPLGKSFTDSAASIVSGLEMLLKIAAGVGIVVFGMRGTYTSWFPHTLSSVVHTSGNWAEGERRSCTLTTTTKAYQLDCTVTLSEERPQQIKVKYTGDDPSDQDNGLPHHWTCIWGRGFYCVQQIRPIGQRLSRTMHDELSCRIEGHVERQRSFWEG